jgi:uncharacterized protein YndB with AHSA1/START domain
MASAMPEIPVLTMVRRFGAAPAAVYAAWTRPELLALWFGPHHTRVESAEADARVGGRFRIALVEDNGARHEVSGAYAEVEPERKLVFSWLWSDQPPERTSRVTVLLRAVPEGTELTLVHDRFADPDTATRHRRGWTESLERLSARFADGAGAQPVG